MGSEILTFGSHCSAKFQPIWDCFKLEYDDLENIKTDRVNAVVYNLHQIKRLKFFLGHPVFHLPFKLITFVFCHNVICKIMLGFMMELDKN